MPSYSYVDKSKISDLLLKYGAARNIPGYHSWKGMRDRCTNSSHKSAHLYGVRGITFIPEWNDFTAFILDMGVCPTGYSLDRLDPNSRYSKENCVWASRIEQSHNSRDVIRIRCGGKVYFRKEIAEVCKFSLMKVYYIVMASTFKCRLSGRGITI
jgi:hypothetical protein